MKRSQKVCSNDILTEVENGNLEKHGCQGAGHFSLYGYILGMASNSKISIRMFANSFNRIYEYSHKTAGLILPCYVLISFGL